LSFPRVSFVVLSYNYARFIGECIQSILNQSGSHDFEIVIVDDASTDNSDAVIRSFTDARIRYIRHEHNQGHASTVTDGLRAARGQLIARIDSDDRYAPNFLNDVLPIFDQHAEVGLVYGDARIINDDGEVWQPTIDTVHGGFDQKGSELVALLEHNFIAAPTVIARRSAWLDALPIPEGLAFHDWYFTVMIARNHELYFRARVLADYRVHTANYHDVIIRNRTEEPSILRFLDIVFADEEKSASLQKQKLEARDRIYAAHYVSFGLKYFGVNYNADARRCYMKAVSLQPKLLFNSMVMRQLAATIMGRGIYERLKRSLKRH
jgi:glycosyltransferase involved in cell wall biosynthesis